MEYHYDPLPKPKGYIRLLKLESGSASPVAGRLFTFESKQAPPYHALSYTWGTGTKNASILLEHCELLITSSLAAALTQMSLQLTLKGPDPTNAGLDDATDLVLVQYLWCDQICINQNDVDERGHQVQQMNRIYMQSERTIIWLGKDTGFAASAFDLVHRIERRYDEETPLPNGIAATRTMMTRKGVGSVDWDLHKRKGLPSTWSRSWRAMQQLFALSWFRRVWIVQEVVLSRRDPLVMLGETRSSWTKLAWAAHWLYAQGYGSGYIPRSVGCIRNMLHMRRNELRYDISALVLVAINHFASDPRDNIYGILGLEELSDISTGKLRSSNVVPDYAISVDLSYSRAIRRIINASQSLTILSLPTARIPGTWDFYSLFGRQASFTNFASWMPHLEDVPFPQRFVNPSRARPGQETSWTLWYVNENHFRASGGRQITRVVQTVPDQAYSAGHNPKEVLDEARGILSLQGCRVDTVKICLYASPWEGLARQNAGKTRAQIPPNLALGGSYLKDRQHWGFFRTLAYLLHIVWISWQRPLAQDIWRTALQYSRYGSPLRVAEAVLDATTAGMDGTYKSWEPGAVDHFAAFMAGLEEKWPTRWASSHLRWANKQLLGIAQNAIASQPERYAASMQCWCGLRRFFVTNEGLIGIGPTSMRKGDVICMLFGGGVPFVLRPLPDKHWHFVGDCYVHGLGDGQAVRALERHEPLRGTLSGGAIIREETFNIK